MFTDGAVVTDAGPCAAAGRDVLSDGGTAVDAAIASLFCMGVYHPHRLLHCVRYSRYTCHVHSSGIGGGFVMTVFSAERQSAEVLVARERAPAWASEDMYGGDPALSAKGAVHVVSTLYVHSIYSVSTQYTHSIYSITTPYLHRIYRELIQYIHNIYTEYTQLST